MVNGQKVEGLPLFDGGFTTSAGIRGRLGDLNSDAPIGLTETAPNAAAIGALGEARRQNRHQAIVVVTRGARPGFCPSNAESFLQPFGPPVLQVSSEDAHFLVDGARQGLEAVLTAHVERTQAHAFNVAAVVLGTNRGLAPLVVMTPRSGWWSCASERGGGLACWLEIMRALRDVRPARDVLFVPSSGHESTIVEVMTDVGLRIDRRIPRRTVPGGEAANIHRGGGRYMSVIGSNDLFHNPNDRGPEAVDVKTVERFASAFAMVTKSLARAFPD